MGKQPEINITFCMVTFNRKDETVINVRRTAPCVNRTVIIDGGSSDGTIEWLNSDECKNLNVECYVYPWQDNPPEQRNRYLNLVKDGWVLALDCDELLDIPALYKLRYIAKEAVDKGCDGVAFRAHDIQIEPDGGIYDSLSSYYNRIFFKSCEGMKYMGHTHVALLRPALRDVCMKTEYKYYHIKPWADLYFRGCRNYWTTARVAANTTNDPIWQEFKKMTADAGFKYFYEFEAYMKKGNIDQLFKDWFIRHKDSDNPELRSWFVSYFMFLHPAENKDSISNKDLQYNPEREHVDLHA